MERTLIIDDAPECIRAAIVEDGVLCELMSEKQDESDQTESLYYGRIQAIRPSVGAAFVDIGCALNAFLPLTADSRLRCGDMIVVQGAARQSTDTKGLRVTDRINLAGRWLVLVPGRADVHISKKIKDPALREALVGIGAQLRPDGCGIIIRTAGEEVTQALLAEEASALYGTWQGILRKAAGMVKPGLLHRRERLDLRLVRDLRGLSRVVINSKNGYEALLDAQREQRICAETRIEHYEERDQLIFDAWGIEPQIDKALKKRVWLPGGGYLVIDSCEAMTVIDVNSGKMILGRDTEDTALRVDLEAAEEIARQLRLRDIGGIVVVDFIDLREEAHRRALLERMKQAAARDRTQVTVEGITRLGLMEITRKRVHSPLRKMLRAGCGYCQGSGELLSAEEVARRALRQVRRMALSGQRGPFLVRCAPAAAQALAAMRAQTQVYAVSAPGRHAERFEIEQIGAGMPLPKEAAALRQEDGSDDEKNGSC